MDGHDTLIIEAFSALSRFTCVRQNAARPLFSLAERWAQC